MLKPPVEFYNISTDRIKLRAEDFVYVPSIGTSVSKTKLTSDNYVLDGKWNELFPFAQWFAPDYVVPSLSQVLRFRDYLKQKLPEDAHREFSFNYPSEPNFPGEWANSVLAFPNEDGHYSQRLRLPEVEGRKGRIPLLIDHVTLKRFGEKYIIAHGKVTEVPNLPLKKGHISEFDKQTGLPIKVVEVKSDMDPMFWVNSRVDEKGDDGLRSIKYSVVSSHPIMQIDAYHSPWTNETLNTESGIRLSVQPNALEVLNKMLITENGRFHSAMDKLAELGFDVSKYF